MTQEEFTGSLIIKLGEVMLEKTLNSFPAKRNGAIRDVAKTIEHFIENRSKTLMIINTTVLSNRRVFLEDIYVPLTIEADKESYLIDCYPLELFNEHSTVLIADTAGMGKSTIMRKLYLAAIYQNLAIPFLIELRRVKENQDIISFILSDLDIQVGTKEAENIKVIFQNGGFVFFLDGFDEVKDVNRESVSYEVQLFVEKFFDSNRFFITSRPEEALAQFGNFEKFQIRGLKMEESFQLINKYDVTGEISDLLIEKLKLPENRNLSEFLKNPLLTSLLFRAFEFKHTIPLKKNQFYRQVFDANYEAHDLTKGGAYSRPKKSGLDIEDFHRTLRYIGFDCFKRQSVEFENKDDILNVIAKSMDFYQIGNSKPSDFLADLITTVPIFSKDGRYYKWSHRSLQEYFAAQFIFLDSRKSQGKILSNIYNHPSLPYYFNTLDLYSDIDPLGFRRYIELAILGEYLIHYDEYATANIENVEEAEVNRRINIMFLQKITIIQSSTKRLLKIPTEDEFSKRDPLSNKLFGKLSKELGGPEKLRNIEFGRAGVLTWPRYGLNTFVMIASHNKRSILNILKRLGRPYIKSFEHVTERKYFKIDIPISCQDNAFKLTLDSGLCYNTPSEFSKVTGLVEMCSGNTLILNREIATKEIDNINQEDRGCKLNCVS